MDYRHMSTSKEEALRAAQNRDKKPYSDFCARVEEAIAECAGTRQQITVQIGDTPRQVVERAMETYRAVGWTCKFEPDQRDGDYICLS